MTISTKSASTNEMPAKPLPAHALGRPIRVVLFGGAFFEAAALEFLARLDAHPDVELLGAFCQSPGFSPWHVALDVRRRRRWMAPAVLATYLAQGTMRALSRPRAWWTLRRRLRRLALRVIAVPDLHAPAVIERVKALAPDLGLVYGAPLLRPELFHVPAFGTIGIHHGTLPQYRGKKLTFWAMLNGETTAGVAIQRLNNGLDTGDVVCAAEVPVAGRRFGRVDADVQRMGVQLFMSAVLAAQSGQAQCRPQPPQRGRIYREPTIRDILRLWWRQVLPPQAGTAGQHG